MRTIALVILAAIAACDTTGTPSWEDEEMEQRDINNVQPELMTASERNVFVNTAFDRAFQGKVVTIPAASTVILAPGSYSWVTVAGGLTLNYVTPLGNVWVLPTGASFSLKVPTPFVNPNPAPGNIQLNYYPEGSYQGVPMRLNFPEAGGLVTGVIEMNGQWQATEITAVNAYVRTVTGFGPANLTWNAAAGSQLQISINAFL